MSTRMSDVIASGGAGVMLVALVVMILDAGADTAPGGPWMVLFILGLIGGVAAVVWRYEHTAAQQPSPVESLHHARRRAEMLQTTHITHGLPSPV